MAAERKQVKMARWMEFTRLEEERLKIPTAAKERKVRAEERKLAIKEEVLRIVAEAETNKRKEREQALMFMDGK